MSYGNFFYAALFITIAIACAFWGDKVSVGYGAFRISAYPWGIYIAGALGLIGLVVAIGKLNSAKKSMNNNNPIIIGDTGFSFPEKNDKKLILFSEIDRIKIENDEDDGRTYIVKTDDDEYEFNENGFDSPVDFSEFMALIEKGRRNARAQELPVDSF